MTLLDYTLLFGTAMWGILAQSTVPFPSSEWVGRISIAGLFALALWYSKNKAWFWAHTVTDLKEAHAEEVKRLERDVEYWRNKSDFYLGELLRQHGVVVETLPKIARGLEEVKK